MYRCSTIFATHKAAFDGLSALCSLTRWLLFCKFQYLRSGGFAPWGVPHSSPHPTPPTPPQHQTPTPSPTNTQHPLFLIKPWVMWQIELYGNGRKMITIFHSTHSHISVMLIRRICVIHLIINIKVEVWPICNCLQWSHETMVSAVSWFAPSQWETLLLCNDVSHWLGTSLESALQWYVVYVFLYFLKMGLLDGCTVRTGIRLYSIRWPEIQIVDTGVIAFWQRTAAVPCK